jgi:hypothetical protein
LIIHLWHERQDWTGDRLHRIVQHMFVNCICFGFFCAPPPERTELDRLSIGARDRDEMAIICQVSDGEVCVVGGMMHKDATRQARTKAGVAARSKRWLTLGAIISFCVIV